MKKSILLFAFTIFTFSAFAQFNFHVGGGPMVNYGDYDFPQTKTHPKTSFFGEIGASFRKKSFQYNLNLQYSLVSWKNEFLTQGVVDPDFNFRLHYLILNPSIEYRPEQKLGISLGGYYAYSVRDEVFNNIEQKFQKPVFDLFEETDFGIQAGINFYLLEDISFGLNYMRGFASLDKVLFTDNDGILIETNDYNQSFQFKIAYSL